MADNSTTTVIGPDTTIKGEINFTSRARLLGTIEGQIAAKGELEVAEGATCKASINAAKVTIDGAVEGNVTASDRVELNAKARLHGDLVAEKLIVAEGASFVGHCRIGPDVNAKRADTNGIASAAAAAGEEPSVAEAKPQPARASRK